MADYRGFVIWGAGAVLVLGLFLVFVFVGWPGEPNACVYETPHACYCEAFDIEAVEAGTPGVRQPVNTWFNLYALFTAFIVAFFRYGDRRKTGGAATPNLMFSDNWIPDLYIFAVLFLGLGSMFYHGSLTVWGGIVDGMSMYVFAAFLPFYSMRRYFKSDPIKADRIFWIGYTASVILATLMHARILPAFVIILIFVVAYLAIEIYIYIKSGVLLVGGTDAHWYWGLAVGSIVAATFFWWASHTSNFMCGPESFFQPHGLLWHPLAGVMAVLLYFYWREENRA